MPRYMVEREFANGLQSPVDETGAHACLAVVEGNLAEQVTWIHSYVSTDKRKTFCVYDGPSPEAIRRTASRNKLPEQRTFNSVMPPMSQLKSRRYRRSFRR